MGWPKYSVQHFRDPMVQALLYREFISALNNVVLTYGSGTSGLQQLPGFSERIQQAIHPPRLETESPAAATEDALHTKVDALLQILYQYRHEAGQLTDRDHPLRGWLTDPISQLAVAVLDSCHAGTTSRIVLSFPFEELSKAYGEAEFRTVPVARGGDREEVKKYLIKSVASRAVMQLAQENNLFLGGFIIRDLEHFKRVAQLFSSTPQFAVTFLTVLDRAAQFLPLDLLSASKANSIVDLCGGITW